MIHNHLKSGKKIGKLFQLHLHGQIKNYLTIHLIINENILRIFVVLSSLMWYYNINEDYLAI